MSMHCGLNPGSGFSRHLSEGDGASGGIIVAHILLVSVIRGSNVNERVRGYNHFIVCTMTTTLKQCPRQETIKDDTPYDLTCLSI